MLSGEQSHGLSNQGRILKHKTEILTVPGEGAPSFKKLLGQNVLPLSWDQRTHGSSIGTPRDGDSMDLPLEVLWTPMVCSTGPMDFHGPRPPMVLPWDLHGTPMGLPWDLSFTMGRPWDFHRASMGDPWDVHETSAFLPWDCDGTSMALPRDFHRTSMVIPLNSSSPIGAPWDLYETSIGVPYWSPIRLPSVSHGKTMGLP